MSADPRDALAWARLNWRITLLVAFLVVSLTILFIPFELVGGAGPVDDTGMTNLQFGLDLGGGASVRAPIAGVFADDVSFDPDDAGAVEAGVAEQLGVSSAEVNARVEDPEAGEGSIEVTAPGVDLDAFLAAVEEIDPAVNEDDVRRGVHPDTRDRVVRVLTERVNAAGLSGADVTTATAPETGSEAGGERFVIVEVPGRSLDDVIDLIEQRGVVEIVAHFPTEDGYRNETVADFDDFDRVDPAQSREGGNPPHVPVLLTSDAAPRYVSDMVNYGFTDEGVANCRWGEPDERPDDPGHCLLTTVDGNVTYAAQMSGDLAEDIRTSNFEQRPIFLMQTTSFEDAQQLEINLNAGGLPAQLAIDRGTTFELEPWLGEEFRFRSLVVGIVAALAVAGMVSWRYRDPRIAAPMLLTASGEVIVLLGFAVAVNMSIGLPEIAGLIAVLGTGVDDLVIIADEIMQRGEIRTNRIFETRFRKAFWVIGVAAATTILAMVPLVGMSLGDLSGFAIVTIVGVVIGVTVTRPAYGNIIRILLLD